MPHTAIVRTFRLAGAALFVASAAVLQTAPPDPGEPGGGPVPARAPVAEAPDTPEVPTPGPPMSNSTAAVVLAFTGLASTLMPVFLKYLDNRKDKEKLEETSGKLGEATEKLDRTTEELKAEKEKREELEAQVKVNEAKLAGVQGQVSANTEQLYEVGYFKAPARVAGQRRPRSTVLIVEDDPATASSLMRLFTRHGFAATHAPTIDEACRLVYFKPHWVILDLKVADRDGEELLRLVKDERIDTQVVVVTGNQDPDRLAAVRAMGPLALIVKPADMDELFALMDPGSPPVPEHNAPEAPKP
jgi:ActR/RegA family two-component response regulator